MDWKKLKKVSHDDAIGLDIGSSLVKIVKLRKHGSSYTVTGAGVHDIVTAEEGDDARKEQCTIEAVRKCLESSGFQCQSAVCSVHGPEVAVRYFEFPSLPAEEIKGAVLLEASQVCPFNVDHNTVDYQVIVKDNDSISGILAAATNNQIERIRRISERASLQSILIDVDDLALLNCFNELEKSQADGSIALLNIGSSCVNLAITGSGPLPFVRDLTFAGNDITKRIAIEEDVSIESIKKILFDDEKPAGSESDFYESFKTACHKLIVDIKETFRYYRTHIEQENIEKIYVCGSFAKAKGFVELLDDQQSAEVVLWNPFDKMKCEAGASCEEVLKKDGPAMVVAAGLAMRSA